MKSSEKIGMAIFALLVLVALVLAIRQGARQRVREARYAILHGWRVSTAGDPRLNGLMEETVPEQDWRPRDVMEAEPPPESVYLFSYQASARKAPSNRFTGKACLAAHHGRSYRGPVVILTRTPGVDKLMGHRVAIGGETFRRKFTVTCEHAEDAPLAVNAEVERILLEHDREPGWRLTTVIAGRQVLVASFWAATEQEWDYLIALARKLRAAVR
jgi:hypothetical protein